ncbi:acyltransferase 3 [Pseudomassariella vexata]|uniref:Acyltransferase 3 n=1 Tax=Pseudomassariella vexata TaxID=1141098 RepID=A0A1Y2E259_9PEZI|nr:acyltransferase 3 [Pseudomassariella vexata]ORY65434.1 acyltransferase 3 [Pseudomassariella vexata]
MATPKPNPTSRRHYLDQLRTYCTAHVIVHHTAGAYGYGGAEGPHSACFDKSSPLLTAFLAVNLAFGLGQFFWLSGFLSAESLSRSTDSKFVKSKLLRLGVPTLLYSAFLDPLFAVFRLRQWDFDSIKKAYIEAFLKFRGACGSAWYTATLLVLDLCAVLFKRCLYIWGLGKLKSSKLRSLTQLYVMLCRWGWLVVAGGSFLIRTRWPPGKKLPIIDVQQAYLLQYIYAYGLGHLAFHARKPRMVGLLERDVPDYTPLKPSPRLSLGKAVAFSLGTLPILLLPGFLKKEKTGPPAGSEMGSNLAGWTTAAAFYALWNELCFNSIGPAQVNYFERNQNQPAKRKLWSPRYSYGAFLLHPPVSWAIGEGVDALLCAEGKQPAWMKSRVWKDLGPILMTGVVGTADLVASFATSMLLVDYVPGVGKLI